MYKLKFIDKEDNLSTKDFQTKQELKEYMKENNIEKIWHQIEEVKKVIPNLRED